MRTIQTQDDAKAVLESIQVVEDYHFPRRELEELLTHPDESVPEMLEWLKRIKNDPERIIESGEYNMSFTYAYLLLAELQEAKAFPIILELLELDTDWLDILFADDLTGIFGRVLASTYDGDLSKLRALLDNEKADEYARAQAAVAMRILVLEGRLDRQEILNVIEETLLRLSDDSCTDPQRVSVITSLVIAAEEIHPAEIADTLREMFERDLVNQGITSWKYTQKALETEREKHLNRVRQNELNQPVRDAVSELSKNYIYQKPEREAIQQKVVYAGNVPVTRQPKVGRNDPCPCGSEKKYKKCCGA
ncbi:DUF1186 domain-containing protein [Saccharibacillus sp. CPCC 101409]|uniref:DUF1186 domain-containing protein n=1 Tax=Saccharibacillus sp. CPCC 101409 TaxID=3058041 RepID=UPI002673FA90|nr:DUF1186 domain-containing protein [Saccharibacillus sp. CPCC 101409]MDO3409467.1 DUF1186 domain-containing protein [Saccharibacillus sp. CPCC 101409]